MYLSGVSLVIRAGAITLSPRQPCDGSVSARSQAYTLAQSFYRGFQA
jgi:hypothetical protein